MPFPPPGNLPDQGIGIASLVSLALIGIFFTTEPLGKTYIYTYIFIFVYIHYLCVYIMYIYVHKYICIYIDYALLLFSCSVMYDSVSDPMDCNPPGSSVHAISQGRILEWVVISFSKGSSRPWDRTQLYLHLQVDSLPLSHLGSSNK